MFTPQAYPQQIKAERKLRPERVMRRRQFTLCMNFGARQSSLDPRRLSSA
jgi:hypothetical protein